MTYQNASDIELKRCILSTPDGSKSVQLNTSVIAGFTFYESILSPFLAANLIVSDSSDLINQFPIQGGEGVSLEFTSSMSDEPIQYDFRVWKIGNRVVKNKMQVYNLGLVSAEALVNETVRVNEQQTGNPEAIIQKMLTTVQTPKTFYSEKSRFEVKLTSNRSRPFDIIAKLQSKSVSPKTNYSSTNSSNTGSSAQQIKGTAGFFFWESRRGYNFFSIDALCDEPGGKFAGKDIDVKAWGPYVETVANRDGIDQRFIISNAMFESEVDLMSALRKGKYSTMMVFFNHSTGEYEEYVYKIKDSYDNMAHLGGQEGISLIPTNQVELSDYPSRIMSVVLDHESWFNDPTPASPEPKDGSKSPTKFADWQKYYAAQSTARAELLSNQECTIIIPGNPLISAGDKIDIRLQSKLADSEKKKKPFDEESSGLYLVKEVTQEYNFLDNTNGSLTTTLRLFRDSYGMKDKPSNRGNK